MLYCGAYLVNFYAKKPRRDLDQLVRRDANVAIGQIMTKDIFNAAIYPEGEIGLKAKAFGDSIDTFKAERQFLPAQKVGVGLYLLKA